MERSFPIVISLPGEPRGKGRPRIVRGRSKDGLAVVRAITPERTRSYEGELRYFAQQVMGDCALVESPVLVTMTALMSVPPSWSKKKQAAALAGEIWPASKPDCDNIAKMKDALKDVVWRDDKQVVGLTVLKTYSAKPELRIVIRPAQQKAKPNPEMLPL